jgi:single-strand DNA-binding protein
MADFRMPYGVAKVFIIGRLTRDPQLRHTQKGQPVTEITVAVNRKQDDTDAMFITANVWGRSAEYLADHAGKGTAVLIEDGRLEERTWKDRNGQQQSRLQVTTNRCQVLEWYESKGQQELPKETTEPEPPDDIPF